MNTVMILNLYLPPVIIASVLYLKNKSRYALSESLLLGFVLFITFDLVIMKAIGLLPIPFTPSVLFVHIFILILSILSFFLSPKKWLPFYKRLLFKIRSHGHFILRRKFSVFFYLLIAAILIVQAWRIGTTPMLDYDGRWYHAGKISLINHKFDVINPKDIAGSTYLRYVHAYPGNAEYFFSHLASFFGMSVKLRFAQLYFGLIGVLALYVLLRRWRVPRFHSELLALSFLLLPSVMAQQQTLYIDAIFASFAFIAFCGLKMRSQPGWYDAAFFLLGNALMIGTKTTGIVITATNCLALLILNRRRLPDLGRGYLRLPVLLMGLACPVVIGGTYVANYAKFGNPLYPVSVKILGRTLPGVINNSNAEGFDGSVYSTLPDFYKKTPFEKTVLTLTERNIWRQGVPPTVNSSTNGFGPIVSTVMLPALFLSVFILPFLDWGVLLILIVLPLMLMQPLQYLIRYILFIFAPLAVSAGVCLARCRPRARARIAPLVMLVIALSGLIGLYSPFDSNGQVAFEYSRRSPVLVEAGNSLIVNYLSAARNRDIHVYFNSNSHVQMIYLAGRDFSNHLHFYKTADDLLRVRKGGLMILPKNLGNGFVSQALLTTNFRALGVEQNETLYERL